MIRRPDTPLLDPVKPHSVNRLPAEEINNRRITTSPGAMLPSNLHPRDLPPDVRPITYKSEGGTWINHPANSYYRPTFYGHPYPTHSYPGYHLDSSGKAFVMSNNIYQMQAHRDQFMQCRSILDAANSTNTSRFWFEQ